MIGSSSEDTPSPGPFPQVTEPGFHCGPQKWTKSAGGPIPCDRGGPIRCPPGESSPGSGPCEDTPPILRLRRAVKGQGNKDQGRSGCGWQRRRRQTERTKKDGHRAAQSERGRESERAGAQEAPAERG